MPRHLRLPRPHFFGFGGATCLASECHPTNGSPIVSGSARAGRSVCGPGLFVRDFMGLVITQFAEDHE